MRVFFHLTRHVFFFVSGFLLLGMASSVAWVLRPEQAPKVLLLVIISIAYGFLGGQLAKRTWF